MNRNFWSDKNIFLTGHTGFKGAWLSLWLQKLGANVTGYALSPPTLPSFFDLCAVGDNMTSIIADIRDSDTLRKSLQDCRPDIVFHMAAQPLVRYSYDHARETYETNVMGLVNLLEAAKTSPGIKAIVNVTSDKCYENTETGTAFTEDAPMGGFDPYSSSKGCAELVSQAYRRSFHMPIATARAGNVIGGGDWAEDRLIPDILRAIEQNEEVIIRNPNAVRPWQHVLDPLYGYLLVAERLSHDPDNFATGWNFAPQDTASYRVQWITEKLCDMWGPTARFRIDEQAADLHEARYLSLDSTKAAQKLGWTARWTLPETLKQIVAWHQAYLGQSDLKDESLSQINQYMGGRA